jgi:hypothetical protein
MGYIKKSICSSVNRGTYEPIFLYSSVSMNIGAYIRWSYIPQLLYRLTEEYNFIFVSLEAMFVGYR